MPGSSNLPAAPFKLSRDLAAAYLSGRLNQPRPPGWAGWIHLLKSNLPRATSIEEKETLDFLDSVQGNIVSPHGRDHTTLLFFRHAGTAEQMRKFLAEADTVVTSALKQYLHARDKQRNRNEPFVSLALTAAGIAAAAARPPEDEAFAEGMWERRERLGDTASWDPVELADPAQIHGVWLLASARPDLLTALEQDIRLLGAGRITIMVRETGVTLRNERNEPVEPFGFRDGISMPVFFSGQKKSPAGLVDLPLSQVMLDTSGAERGGSFLVYRKLRQHVAVFRDFERGLAEQARLAKMDPSDAGRLLVGRTRDGRPLADITSPQADLNRFDFSGDRTGAKCPFHAHIRKANPRTLTGRVPTDQDSELGAQIVRRGAVFGTGLNTRYDPRVPAPENTGLLFLAYMADIAKQFERLQVDWMSQSQGPDGHVSQPDPILFGGGPYTKKWQWSGLPGVKLTLPSFVTALGGAYLFVPPRQWLRRPPPK